MAFLPSSCLFTYAPCDDFIILADSSAGSTQAAVSVRGSLESSLINAAVTAESQLRVAPKEKA